MRPLAERLGFTVGWEEREQKISLTKGDTTINLWIGSTRVVVNGKEGTVDVPPKKVDNRTFVPVRFVAECLGAHVAWDSLRQTAVVSSGKSFLLKLNAQQKPVDQKTTGDFQMQMDVTSPDGAKGGNISVKIPMHMEMRVYHNDALLSDSLSMSLPGQSTSVVSGKEVPPELARWVILWTEDPLPEVKRVVHTTMWYA
ncbi:MAG: copper amine oxidase family protein [Firmicutes bacterium]|nr:copper amine oxidase family protein [Bacillota bacterium]